MAGGSEKGKPNKMTIDEVAKALGVSATTVSRALSGKGAHRGRIPGREFLNMPENMVTGRMRRGAAVEKYPAQERSQL